VEGGWADSRGRTPSSPDISPGSPWSKIGLLSARWRAKGPQVSPGASVTGCGGEGKVGRGKAHVGGQVGGLVEAVGLVWVRAGVAIVFLRKLCWGV
jgi:hypothetical protein